MDKDEQIVDGIVEEEDTLTLVEVPAGTKLETNSQVTAMFNLEELIKNHIESIEKLKAEIKQHKEMFDDSFNNNPTYREHEERVKEATKAKSSVKSQIAKQPSVAMLEQKVKDLRFDVSEQAKTLSDLLQDYKEQTGATQIETRNGQVLEIVSTSKLVKKNTKYNA